MNKLLILFFIVCLLVIASIFWFCSLPGGIALTTEAKFRLSGMVLQVYGIGAVALKLSEARQQFVRGRHLIVGVVAIVMGTEPPRVYRRPFRLSHAAMASCSSMA
jgi:hypothetical protein